MFHRSVWRICSSFSVWIIDKNAIQRIESGKRFVTDIELRYFAKVLKVSYEELLAGDDPLED